MRCAVRVVMCGGAECGDGVERCRYLDRNAITGSVPSEMGELNSLEVLCVHTALNCPNCLGLCNLCERRFNHFVFGVGELGRVDLP